MGKILDEITDEMQIWMQQQKMFFVATSPLSVTGHINCSPKGMDTFRILDKHSVCYMDLTGSGIETTAHLKENGRIVVMFCAFDGPPNIARLHGTGVVSNTGNEFEELKKLFPSNPGIRSIIKINVSRVSTSCGFAVPLYDFKADRQVLNDWAAKKSPKELSEYRQQKNSKSIDGLQGLSQ